MKYYNQIAKFLPCNSHFNYFNKHILVNSQGYRTKEFDDIDWNNSIVLFGCSMAFGAGLDDNETICYQLSQRLDRPVINLGVPASSIVYSLYNQLALKEMGVKPYAVVNLWTSAQRHTYFFENKPTNLGPWIKTPEFNRSLCMFYALWSSDTHNVNSNSMFLKRVADMLWVDDKHVQASFFDDTSKLFDVPLLQIEDRAEDNEHPGPLTAKAVAEQLALWCR
jgi:hypothetical protein